MKIGTDISIAECRVSGYPVIEFKKRDLIKNGKLDKDASIRVTVSLPYHWNDSGRPSIGFTRRDLYIADGYGSFNDFVEIFESYGDSIKDFCDLDNCPIDFENPSIYDLLSIISAIDGYSGLYTWGFCDHERY